MGLLIVVLGEEREGEREREMGRDSVWDGRDGSLELVVLGEERDDSRQDGRAGNLRTGGAPGQEGGLG